jgi:hypothetical protein
MTPAGVFELGNDENSLLLFVNLYFFVTVSSVLNSLDEGRAGSWSSTIAGITS